MGYILSFLEGIVTFLSPCLLPMLPVYLFYFAGEKEGKGGAKAFWHAVGFVMGFTVVFLLLGAFAGTVGGLLRRYRVAFNLVTGGAVILFGLHYLGVLRIALFGRMQDTAGVKITGVLSAFLFGLVFSISWTPCVGAFLGSALMLASQQGSARHGILLLLCYSAGLGIPFVLSAIFLDRLKTAFDFIKKHYGVITGVSGAVLIGMGVLMATGLFNRFLTFLAG